MIENFGEDPLISLQLARVNGALFLIETIVGNECPVKLITATTVCVLFDPSVQSIVKSSI